MKPSTNKDKEDEDRHGSSRNQPDLVLVLLLLHQDDTQNSDGGRRSERPMKRLPTLSTTMTPVRLLLLSCYRHQQDRWIEYRQPTPETGERYVNTNVPVPLINRGSCPVPPTGIDNYAASTHRIISLSSNLRHPGTTAYTTATATGSSASLGIASLSINEPNSVPTLNSLTLGEVGMENYALTFGGATYGLGRSMPIERMIELIEEEWTFNEALLRSLGHGDNKSN
ncbi:hypothetical protein BKA57DRAFT_510706 [Linnemannia elongata]|nr:hypothetical protein BKA57DRAFT_510706 [Linnemannia elongata]